MKTELRKVVFNMNEQELTIGDLSFDDTTGILEERQGYFHCWGDRIIYNRTNEEYLSEIIGVVEEMNTGKVYEVRPKNIKFEISIDSI